MTYVQKIRALILREIKEGSYKIIAKLASRKKLRMVMNLLVGLYNSCYLYIVSINLRTAAANLHVVITDRPMARVKLYSANVEYVVSC
jgi:hypothetical protein